MGFAGTGGTIEGPITYYEEYTTTNLYAERSLGGYVKTIAITNDSTSDPVQVSYDGSTQEAEIKAGESWTLHTPTRSSVYIKATAGGDKVRILAW